MGYARYILINDCSPCHALDEESYELRPGKNAVPPYLGLDDFENGTEIAGCHKAVPCSEVALLQCTCASSNCSEGSEDFLRIISEALDMHRQEMLLLLHDTPILKMSSQSHSRFVSMSIGLGRFRSWHVTIFSASIVGALNIRSDGAPGTGMSCCASP